MQNKFAIQYLVLNLLASTTYAHDYWPTFSYPDKELTEYNYLNTKDCPQGEEKLNSSLSINVSQHCNGLCRPDWVWVVSKNDGACHRLDEISFKGYQIKYLPDDIY